MCIRDRYNVVGIKWVVTDNGVTKTYTSADFPAPGTADSPLVLSLIHI